MATSLTKVCALVLSLPGVALAHPLIPSLARDTEAVLAGKVLLSELNCTACHAGDIPAKGAPDLRKAGSRIRRGYLVDFISNPQAAHPGTTMPDLLDTLPPDERASTADALADFLVSIDEGEMSLTPPDEEAGAHGRELFHTVGCVACHAPDDKPLPDSAPLNRLTDKYSLASLTAFLEDPLAVRPDGRMPDMKLSHWEATDIAHYLLRAQVPAEIPPPKPTRAEEGKQFFETLGCAQCHTPKEAKPNYAKGLSHLDPTKDCPTARFDFSETQRSQITSALQNPDAEVDPIRLTLTRLNCIACHSRDDFGGPSPERDAYFTTSNLNLGDQARVPPSLSGVGAKLTPAWLRKVIIGGEGARPYMLTRMPKFGAANVEHLIDLFEASDSLPAATFQRVKDPKLARESGFQLVGITNLGCVACHTFNGESATTLAGMELTNMPERLREDWFHHFLGAPQDFNPTTIMPAFWPGGKPVRPEVLDGDSGKQIDAIWQYLSQGREARLPEGIRREPLEYGPSNGKAVLLRRQYNGIGKRGIGVGYPSGINLAFDAEQMRLGTVWNGDFGEMSGVWRGQGSGNVGERSREVVRFPVGPAFARLATPDAEWPQLNNGEKAPGLQFLGYTLDDRERPTFRYRFETLEIVDAFLDSPQGPALTRSLTLSEPAPPDFYLRLAADKDLKPGEDENTYVLPQKLMLVTPPGTSLRADGELRLPLAGKQSITLEYRFQSQ